MISFFRIVVYEPLYNFLILILNIPYVDAGLAAVFLTVLVKVVLFPLTKKAMIAQFKMKKAGGELNEIKKKYKDRETQALKIMEFYKSNQINPFSSIFSIFIQIPIVYSLYYIFLKSGLPQINAELLYDFVKSPEAVSMEFLGFIDVSNKSIVLAALAAVTSFIQMHLSQKEDTLPLQNQNDLPKMIAKQMKFTLPLVIFFVSWQISGVIALYILVSNVVSIVQERSIKKSFLNSEHPKEAVNLVPKN